jgi:hypothetical protein
MICKSKTKTLNCIVRGPLGFGRWHFHISKHSQITELPLDLQFFDVVSLAMNDASS